MDRWVDQYPNVAFVCVSCDGASLAVTFGRQLHLSKCTLGYINGSPSWGQLGCSGFIVLDESLQVLCPATAAFLQVREAAFRHVESILDSQLALGGVVSKVAQVSVNEAFDLGDRCDMPPKQSAQAPAQGREGPVAPLGPIARINVEVLDAQHERCAAALAELARSQSQTALRAVLAVYEEHFAHEEAMLDRYLYNGGGNNGGGGFSLDTNVRTSHWSDHARQLNALREQLQSLPSCTEHVPAVFVDQVLRNFESHANLYDSYGDRLSAALEGVH